MLVQLDYKCVEFQWYCITDMKIGHPKSTLCIPVAQDNVSPTKEILDSQTDAELNIYVYW